MTRRFVTVALHLLAWVLFFSLPVLLMPKPVGLATGTGLRPPMTMPVAPAAIGTVMIMFNLLLAAFFYANSSWLLPRLWRTRGLVVYLAGIGVCALVVVGLPVMWRYILLLELRQNNPLMPQSSFANFGTMVMVTNMGLAWAVSSGLWLAGEYQKSERSRMESENARLDAELAQLKSQINPHFLFNTLNGIYTLSLAKSDAAPEAILRLSHLLRYVTGDAAADFVPVERDLEHLRYFVELHQMRLSSTTPVYFSIEGNPEPYHNIAPLLLLPFVENAFKFGVSTREETIIYIRVHVSYRELTFFCQNKIMRRHPDETGPSGIGIANTQRRLALLYPEKHHLNIREHNGLFQVNLTIQTGT